MSEKQLSTTPAELLSMAVSQGADLDKLEKLMELQQRWEADQARKAYVSAMTAFKADPPKVMKTKRVRFEKKTGGVTDYNHATLADVCDAAIGGLSKHGLSHSWAMDQAEGKIKVTCTITHEQGHSESVHMTASPDDSAGKNGIQAIGSAVTYMQRYTLMGMLGLASYDMDDDGQKAGEDSAKADLLADLMAKVAEAPTLDDLKALASDIAKAKFPQAMRREIGAAYKAREGELS